MHMEFVAEADPSGEVVIMAQVENEIGLLDDSRDRSETAEKLFLEKVVLSGATNGFFPRLSEGNHKVLCFWDPKSTICKRGKKICY